MRVRCCLTAALIFLALSVHAEENPVYLIVSTAKDDSGSAIGYHTYLTSRSLWRAFGDEELAAIIYERFKTDKFTTNIVRPGWCYVYFTEKMSDGRTKAYLFNSKTRESHQSSIEMAERDAKNGGSIVEEGCNNFGSAPMSTAGPVRDFSAFSDAFGRTSIESGLYECPGAKNRFQFRQLKPGLFTLSNGEDAAKINASELFEPDGDDERIIKQVQGQFAKALDTVCGDATHDDPGVSGVIYNAARSFIMDGLKLMLELKADECESGAKPASECQVLRRRAASTGRRD